jgi:hypothetical protein
MSDASRHVCLSDAVGAAQNKLVTVHLAILGVMDAIGGPRDALPPIERVFAEALEDLERALTEDTDRALAA